MVAIPNPWIATVITLLGANIVFQYQLAKMSGENRTMLRLILESEDISVKDVKFDIFDS